MQYGIWNWLRTWWWAWLLILTGHTLTLSGCAGELAALEGMKTVRTTATVLANKIPIQSGEMNVNTSIDDGCYTVWAGVFHGGFFQMRLDGVEVNADLAGRGTGGTNTVDPELAAIIMVCRDEPKLLAEKVLEYYAAHNPVPPATTQPVP